MPSCDAYFPLSILPYFSVFQFDSMTERRRQKHFETTQFGQRIPLGLDVVLFIFVYSNQDRTGVPSCVLLF